MATTHTHANGHRRRQVRAQVLAEETHCIICGEWVDKTLTIIHGPHCDGDHINNRRGCTPHPHGPVVDEDIPRSRGGSPTDRNNCHLAHRKCNEDKGDYTLAEYAATLAANNTGHTERPTTTNLINW